MCFTNDDGYAEFYRLTNPIARAAHRCDECDRIILRGDKYARHSGKYDGRMFSTPVCESCERIRDLIHRREIREGCAESESWCPIGELREHVDAAYCGRLLEFGESLND